MSLQTSREPPLARRVFSAWSVEIPAGFAETFVLEDGYWHAWDDHRSVSMTSIVVTERNRPVSLAELAAWLPSMEGTPIDDMPHGLVGHATLGPSIGPARASTILTGILAIHGRVLLVTVTAEDEDWMLAVWTSIRSHNDGEAPVN